MILGSLFTRDYLLEGVARTQQWKQIDQAALGTVEKRLKAIAADFLKIKKPNEAETEKNFIYPVLEALGWADYQVQQILSKKGRKQVPDALLFADSAARDRAVAEAEQWRRFQHGLAVLEAKRWDRALDRADKRDPGEDGVPSTQMLQYLSRVDVQTSGKVKLGILTNGAKWRLYFQGALSVSEDFFEVDLGKALELPGFELDLVDMADDRLTRDVVLRLFVLMFGKPAFLPLEGPRTFHDISRETARVWEEQVTKDLSTLVFGELFPTLVDGLAEHDPMRPAEVDATYLELVRQNALVLLYRLLFVVYAEDRDLLPDKQEPYKSYSLTTMRLDIVDGRAAARVFSSSIATYWPKLIAVFKAIGEGDDSLGIPPYNGGLFAKDSAVLLDRVQLPDDIVANLIFGLSHRSEAGEDRYINYRDLSVQQLGTIYERTLEYGLRYESGRVRIDADDTARHESGSYYTPDSLVSLIINKAVGPFIEEKLEAFRGKAAELAIDTRRVEIRLAELRGLDPASAILGLKICDPAMGSGHFLVNLVDWLADRALAAIAEAEALVDWSEKPYLSPVLGSIDQTRQDIIEQATQHKWPFVIEHLDDKHIIRRTILKRCIYGLDKNPMAVELAKVALWLHTFTVGAPLSFLDHHLRCGNSLFGFWMREAMDRLTDWGGQLLINEPMQKAMAQAAAMQKLERVTDVDIAEVVESKTLFDGIEQETRPLNVFMKILYALDWLKLDKDDKAAVRAWLDGQFGDPFEIARGRFLLGPSDLGDEHIQPKDVISDIPASARQDAERFASLLNQARAIIRDERFHNWQVAYPGVWTRWESSELHGGFDAVIGNPPYVRQELIRPIKPALKRAFPETYSGTADLYVYFYDQGLQTLKPGGRLSYVVTNKWMRAGYAENLRELLAEKSWIEFVADFGHAKKFFPEADVFPSVIVVRKPDSTGEPHDPEICAVSRDDVPEKDLDEFVSRNTYPLPRAHFTRNNWVLEEPRVVDLLDKIRTSGVSLSDYLATEPLYGIKTGLNEAYLIDASTRDRLVADDPGADEFIKPYMRGQDVQRWSSPDTGLFMIVMKSSENFHWPWSMASDETSAERLFRGKHPSLYRHFKSFEEFTDTRTGKRRGLRHREDQGRYWWELRSCAYYDAFEAPKTLYVDIAWTPSLQVDQRGRYTSNTCYFLPTISPSAVASLNSPIGWWYAWRTAQHGKDEALRYFTSYISAFPIAILQDEMEEAASKSMERLANLVEVNHTVDQAIASWLDLEFDIKKLKGSLLNPTSLKMDSFLNAVRDALPRSRRLTVDEISELRREHADTIEPARQSRTEIFALEQQLSNLVNEAYGLTREEVDLLWRTAPPRMPFTPARLGQAID